MVRYVAGRLLMVIPAMLVVIFIIFCILNITPGDPGRMILGTHASEQAVEALNKELGMDKPMLERFGNYLLGILKLDFGWSYQTRKPVFDDIFNKFPVTLTLALLSISVSALIGIPVGILSAVKKGTALDYAVTASALFLASVPGFFLGLVLMLIFSLWLGVLPSNGIGTIAHFILPVFTLALPTSALLARTTRASMLETMQQDYIRTAKAKGAGRMWVIFRHALKPALLPVITVLGIRFAGMLAGTLMLEMVFGLPGIGSVLLAAVYSKDAPVILAIAILTVLIYKLVMLLVDIALMFINPRLKAQFIR